MMVLEETGVVPAAALPVAALADHLRLGTAFQGDLAQAAMLESLLRAALAVVEGRTGKALLAREFRILLGAWRGIAAQALPLAPVSALDEVALVDSAGARVVLEAARYRLERDAHRPRLVMVAGTLPMIPASGRVEIALTAGFGADWADVPADLQQAVMLLAAQFYETRHDAGDGVAGLPLTVQALLERWRTVRLLGGGA
ncbi:head-tail connector protein [Paragemmobacter ruber]|uniref:PhiE125 gp8 family phage protein n=1 Tax=Paragemmobacter ruber TaxID=1985673 RepID=A0ABW9Y7W9_9RHOB|nr:head-tail connector protein [Rhodobacter ruber]NBE08685.1 hypothetical protein [Rhodobacter ruber]